MTANNEKLVKLYRDEQDRLELSLREIDKKDAKIEQI